jgi:hypothetical protein
MCPPPPGREKALQRNRCRAFIYTSRDVPCVSRGSGGLGSDNHLEVPVRDRAYLDVKGAAALPNDAVMITVGIVGDLEVRPDGLARYITGELRELVDRPRFRR